MDEYKVPHLGKRVYVHSLVSLYMSDNIFYGWEADVLHLLILLNKQWNKQADKQNKKQQEKQIMKQKKRLRQQCSIKYKFL